MARSEEWRDVPGFEGTLVASSHGRVARIQGYSTGYGYTGVSVHQSKGSHPALTAKMKPTNRGCYNIAIHRVVAVTFLGNPPEGKYDINHLDGVKSNNKPDNLQWISRGDNVEHARQTGLHKDPLRKYTESHYKRARALRKEGMTYDEIAVLLGMTRGAVVHAAYTSRRGRSVHRPWREVA